MLRAQKAGTAAKDPMKALRRLLSITFGDRKGHFAVILLCIIVSSIAIVFSASFLGTLVDSFIVPVIGVFLGWQIGGETITWRILLTCVLIVGSVFFVMWDKHNK